MPATSPGDSSSTSTPSPCARSSADTCAKASTPSPAPRCRRCPPGYRRSTAGVERVVEHAPEFEIARRCARASRCRPRSRQRSVVALLARELVEFRASSSRPTASQRHDDAVQRFFSLPSSCARCGLSQILGLRARAFIQASRSAIEVKDTSAILFRCGRDRRAD